MVRLNEYIHVETKRFFPIISAGNRFNFARTVSFYIYIYIFTPGKNTNASFYVFSLPDRQSARRCATKWTG